MRREGDAAARQIGPGTTEATGPRLAAPAHNRKLKLQFTQTRQH